MHLLLIEPLTMSQLLIAILGIVVIDIVLAGDNAVLIALAVRKLQGRQRKLGIVCGAAVAVLLRIILTAFTTKLLSITGLKLIGGALILYIAVKLLRDNTGEQPASPNEAGNLWQAIWMITIADITMSLDNVLAVAGAAHADMRLLIFGLVLSIPLVVFTSNWIASMMDRYKTIIYIGAGILGWVGGSMLVGDQLIVNAFHPQIWHMRLTESVCAIAVIVVPWLLARSKVRQSLG